MSERALATGADGYLQKGMSLKRILEYVRGHRRRHHRRDDALAGAHPGAAAVHPRARDDARDGRRRRGRSRGVIAANGLQTPPPGPTARGLDPARRVRVGRAVDGAVRRPGGGRRAAVPDRAREPDRAAAAGEPGPVRRTRSAPSRRCSPTWSRSTGSTARRRSWPTSAGSACTPRCAAPASSLLDLPRLDRRGHRRAAPGDRDDRARDPRPGRGAVRDRRVDHPGRRRR